MTDPQPNPNVPAQPVPFAYPLARFCERAAARDAVRIVAIGSSSTAGQGAIIPYPCRLELGLRSTFADTGRFFDVINRGRGGEEAPDERKRLGADVIALQPDLVIWQVGTNAVWKGRTLDDLLETARAIREGLQLLRDVDVILMDPQFTPAVATPDKIWLAEHMVDVIASAAEAARVNVFRRFDLMRRWHLFEMIAMDRMVNLDDPDRLHQGDWSTQRVADALAAQIAAPLRAKLTGALAS